VPLTLAFSGLPAGVTAEVKRNGAGPMESYEVTFKTAPPPPRGSMRYIGSATSNSAAAAGVIEGDVSLVLTKPAQ